MPHEEKTKVVIIGAGAAGVFTAYRLTMSAPECFDIKILEGAQRVGGHTISHDEQKESQQVNIDGGAQFFSETAQPNYCAMLKGEKFFDPGGPVIQSDVGVTIWDETNGKLLFRIPSTLLGILKQAVADPFNWLNFVILTEKAIEQRFFGDWNETFGHWLDSVPLLGNAAARAAFKADIARPLMYQFGLVPPPELDGLSAKFVVYYYVGSLPWQGGAAPFSVYNSAIGLDGILKELLKRAPLVSTQCESTVESIAPQGAGYVVTLADGRSLDADEVVFAINPTRILPLLPADTAFDAVRNVLNGMDYVEVPVHIQYTAAPQYMPDTAHHSVSNVLVIDDPAGKPASYMLSVWFGPLRTQLVAQKYFKSWGSPGLVPPNAAPIIVQHHHLMVGTPEFIAKRETLRSVHQGKLHLWYAGGYIVDYDSQDACLRSASFVADALAYQCMLAPAVAGTAFFGPERRHSALADREAAEALAGAEFKRRPALLDAIEREIVDGNPEHPAVLEWLARRRPRTDRG
jgi:predicted NAD/FAD-binding protein